MQHNSYANDEPASARYFRIPQAVAYAAIARTGIYNAIGRGEIIARKHGKTLLVDRESLDRFLDHLPKAVIRAPAQKAA